MITAPKRLHVEDLYKDIFGNRDRSFYARGRSVYAVDDGGGFIVCEINYSDEKIAVLIAELLNQARDWVGTKQEDHVDIVVKKTVKVRFKTKGRYLRPDGNRSFHDWGEVIEVETGNSLGRALLTFTKNYDYSFAYNKEEFDYAIRGETKIEYFCFRNSKGEEYAITLERARELNPEILTSLDRPNAPFYRFFVADLGEIPF